MQRLGLILHVSPSRNMIVKVENTPRIGETVIDENLKPIGKVVDIFGPLSSPYAAVRPTVRDPERLTNRTIYVFPSKQKEKNRHGQ